MINFQLFSQNLINTTSMIGVSSGSATVGYLFDRNKSMSFQTEGYTGATQCAITITFPVPTVISTVMLQNHNVNDLAWAVDWGGMVIPPSIAPFGPSDSYIELGTATASALTIFVSQPTSGEEIRIGELVVTNREVLFDNNPDSTSYDPKFYKHKIEYTMPDGGTNLFLIANKFQASINLRFASNTLIAALKELYEVGDAIYFVPEATTGTWDGEAHEVVFTNDWDFTYAENSRTQGYNGKIVIKETANT